MSHGLPHPDAIRLGVLGLGYVGLPLLHAFSKHFDCVGFDPDARRIAQLGAGIDRTGELDADELEDLHRASLSADAAALDGCNVFVVAVPTPVDRHKYPDLEPLRAASRTVAARLRPGALVVYESTVYPGATEEVCIPLLEQGSGLVCNRDFWVGYSPERINPGDRQRRLRDVVKVTSGSNPEAGAFVDGLYRRIVPAGTHLAPDIRTAEAAKAIENTQRDVNIALMNELAMVFHRLGMDTGAVLAAARSKWNFLPFSPGLVGGHCIGVDPYYLIHKAEEAGHHPALITAARRINEGMAGHVVARLLRLLARKRLPVAGARVLVLGVTFKEDCPDLRNSQVLPILAELTDCGMHIALHDPRVDAEACAAATGLTPIDAPRAGAFDAVLLAVAHREYRELGAAPIRAFLREGGVLFDLKQVLPREAVDERL